MHANEEVRKPKGALMEKLPPIQKIYEAYSALADDRFDLRPEEATVTSSDGSRTYEVRWSNGLYRSTDNATYWQGYAGYPVIVVLLLQGLLPYDAEVASWFADIPWKALNEKHARDYGAALREAFQLANLSEEQAARAEAKAAEDMAALGQLDIQVGRLRA